MKIILIITWILGSPVVPPTGHVAVHTHTVEFSTVEACKAAEDYYRKAAQDMDFKRVAAARLIVVCAPQFK